MNRHLVTIEIGIECGTYQWMKLNCFTFYQNRFKCLDTKTVKCRSTVQHNRMLFDYIFKHIPYFRLKTLYHFLSILNIVSSSALNKFFYNKRLEQLDCHFFRKTALIDLQFRSYNDNGTS